jgi:4-hydroxy-tetrahydrodipicolinate reductase
MQAKRRVLVVGALGRMGERVRAVLAEEELLQLGAALEAPSHPGLGRALEEGVRVSDDAKACLASCDVAIVFAIPDATLSFLREAADAAVPCVVGTTGFRPEQRAEIDQLAGKTPIVLAANFSVAVNVLFHLVRQASRLLGPDYDAEIVELHHSAKMDAPSGTALHLGSAAAEGRGQSLEEHLVLAREGNTGARPAGKIGIQALRGGDNPGEHTVMFIGKGERLELAHRSGTRDHFARGAVRAAIWILGRESGFYDMEQVLGLSTGGELGSGAE